jgi:hypothetical protein
VNAGFPSHTIDAGVPCNLKIFSKNGKSYFRSCIPMFNGNEVSIFREPIHYD